MYRHINGIELSILGRKLERKKKKLFPLRRKGTGVTKNCLAIQDRSGNYQKAFSLFGTETGNPKKFSLYLGTGIQGVPISKYAGTRIPADVKRGWVGGWGVLNNNNINFEKGPKPMGGGGQSGPEDKNKGISTKKTFL